MKKTFVCILIIVSIISIILTACTSKPVKEQTNLNVPVIKLVELLDESSNPLETNDGWVRLQAKTKIRVEFEGNANVVEFFTAPTGTGELFEEIRCIGTSWVSEGVQSVELDWEVPNGFIGRVMALVYNGDIARTSSTNELIVKAIYE